MQAPPTNGSRILVYGQDSTLLETRRMLLASAGFRVNTVSRLRHFRASVTGARPPYDLFILCHTVPTDERDVIQAIAAQSGIGLYQLRLMESPPHFVERVSDMTSDADA